MWLDSISPRNICVRSANAELISGTVVGVAVGK